MGLRDNLLKDAVAALRVPEAVTMSVDATVREAVQLMRERREGCVLITEHGKPTGVFTERDLITKVLANEVSLDVPIVEVMTRSPQVIGPGCTVAEVIRMMHVHGFRHMPVVETTGAVKGMVSVKRIVEYMVEHFPGAVFNLPPEPVQRQLSREGA